MLKVTISNVTRLSEDALYNALEGLPESHPDSVLINAEIDRRIESAQRLVQKQHQMQLESIRLTHAIQDEIQAIFAGYKGKKTLILIESLGQEFIEDYTICDKSFTVVSLVAHRSNYDVPSKWEFDTIEKAISKKAQLIYYRIYEKFMRDATQDNLEILQKVLKAA